MDYSDRNRNQDQRITDALNQRDRVNYAKAGSTGGNEGSYDVDDKSHQRLNNRINRRERNTESRRHLTGGVTGSGRNFGE